MRSYQAASLCRDKYEYLIKAIAEARSEVLQLSLYHCQCNLLEFICGESKANIVKKDTFKVAAVKLLVEEKLLVGETLITITPENWIETGEHTDK